MRIKSKMKRPAAVSRIAFFALLLMAMAAATLHLDALTAHAAQATLSWAAPTTYTDGTPLSGLSGYKIYMGTTSGNYSQNVSVGNVTSHTLTALNDATTYYFAVTANDSSGIVSKFSNQVAFTTSAAPPPTPLYTLAASAGSGGSITPSGSVAISKGLNQTFAIAPQTGYKIAGVTVDGASVGAVSSYTFSNVAANHSIAATFAASSSYTLSATAGTGGSISPAGATAISSGGSKAYTITPATGYKIAGVTVDGASVGAVSGYTFSNVTANHTIAASFASTSTSATMTSSGTWQNRSVASQGGAFTVKFDMIPSANNINAVTGFSAGQADAYADQATTVRFNPTGTIDARNGSTYAARVAMPYSAGKLYRVRMLINVPNHRYDVYVTPPGGVETQLAAGYAFRTEQAAVSVLNNLSTFAATGSHQLSNLSVTAAATIPSMTSSVTWLNRSIASQSGTFTASFDMIPNANNINAVTGFSAGQADAYTDQATIVRFNPTGTIDARNGSTYAARVAMPYLAGKVYRVRMLINVPNHRYDVYVTPPGGAETQLAAGYAFRTEQAAVSVLNNLSAFAATGSHQVLNLSLQ